MSEIPGISARVDYIGPFSSHEVVVNGWKVPFLTAGFSAEDEVMLVCDSRLAATFTLEEAERFVPFLADCIAVALGYGAFPQEGDKHPLSRHQQNPRLYRMVGISAVGTEEHNTESRDAS